MTAISENLNLGCGDRLFESTEAVAWVNLDKFDREGVHIVSDIEDPLPFTDNSFHLVMASHIIEHVANYDQLIQEIHRVLKPGGVFVVRVPEFPCHASVADPDHKRYFVPESFFHLTPHNIGPASKPHLKGLFDIVYINVLKHNKPELDDGQLGRYFTEIHCELVCLKEE